MPVEGGPGWRLVRAGAFEDKGLVGEDGVQQHLPGDEVEGVAFRLLVDPIVIDGVDYQREQGEGPSVDEGHSPNCPRCSHCCIVPADVAVVPAVILADRLLLRVLGVRSGVEDAGRLSGGRGSGRTGVDEEGCAAALGNPDVLDEAVEVEGRP